MTDKLYDDNWFQKLFIDEARAALDAENSSQGGGITPTGSITITENGEYDVTEKATAIVEVEGDEPVIIPLEITENGTYTAEEGIDGYSPVTVNVEGDGGVSVYEVADEDELPDDAADGSIGIVEFENNTDEGMVKQILEGTATEIKDDTVETIRASMFTPGWTNLVSVDFPNLKTIESRAFYGCANLALTELPSGLTSIRDNAFKNCTSLAITRLPSGLTGAGTGIGVAAFAGCTNLRTLIVPGNGMMFTQTFQNCTNLTTVTFESKPSEISNDTFTGCTNLTTINVPWGEREVPYAAPWGATNATINYNYTGG